MTARVLPAVCAAALLTAGCTQPQHAPQAAAQQESSTAFHTFVNDYFNELYRFRPSDATAAGFHEYDDRLEDLSTHAVAARIQTLRSLEVRIAGLRREPLGADENIDAQILEGQIKSELLDLERLETWRRNPMLYVGLPGNAVDGLMKRDFAPARDRLRSVIKRMQQIPAVLAAMETNIKQPPREFVDLALRMAQGSTVFFTRSVAQWAAESAGGDQELTAAFQTANRDVAAAFERAVKFLKTTVQPGVQGSYAIGEDAFRKKLAYEEMVDTPLGQLLEIGERNLDRDYRDFVATARKINPNAPAAAVFKSLSANHPSEQELIPTAGRMLEGLRQFVTDHHLLTFPSEVRPLVTETPPYARSGTFASMDTPGAYEKRAKEAFYYVTPPEKDWTPAHKEEHLRAFGRPVLDVISVHEVFPGHFTQFLYVRQFPTKTRKLVACGTNVEGWAHYAEQMMLEEGLGGGDPKFRLAQLSEALVRDARYVAGIKLHTQQMTVEQATRLFMDKAFQERSNGFEEARRGTYNPTYLYYTLGKLQIYKLREDYRKVKGNSFSLQAFHDAFLKQGGVPLKAMRQLLLPGNTGPVL